MSTNLRLKCVWPQNSSEPAASNDFIVLEYFLNKSITLRLNERAPIGDLKEAHEVSTIITRLISILMAKFDGKLPCNPVIDARKVFAKFIGLSLFKLGRDCLIRHGPNCAIEGACCFEHRVEGLHEAHDLFSSLFSPFDIELEKIDASCDTFITSLLALYAELKCQLVIGALIVFIQREQEANPGSEINSSHRLENLLEVHFGSAMHFTYLKGKLQARAVQIRSIVEQNALEAVPQALKAKFSIELFESSLRNILRSVYAAFPPIQMESRDAGLSASRSAINEEKEVARSKSPKRSGPPVEVKKSEETSPFNGVTISGKFFRGVLEPVDDRFAAIIEGRDINVKQYLAQRERLASKPPQKPVKTVSTSNLLQRHDSAERISWESQVSHEAANECDNLREEVKAAATAESSENEEEEIIRVSRPSSARKASTPHATHMKRPLDPDPTDRFLAPVTPGAKRGRRMFTEQETLNLIEGIRRFGRDWRRIQQNYEFHFRTNVDLKDKARNLEKLGLL